MSNQDDQAQHRRFARAAVDLPATVIVPGHELIMAARALDLSAGGMRVATTADLPTGQKVVVRFSLPDSSHDMLLHGRIVLSYYDASKQYYVHGIAFTQFTRPDHAAIIAYVLAAQPQR
ncbi:MAG: PilZ domain-containing protein [Vulcanimicrobiaceae bacterium]